jgi:hypothetical protein
MSNIKVKDLSIPTITGSDLFLDSESFMRDLSDNELDLQGGKAPRITARISIFCCPIIEYTPHIVVAYTQ